MTNNVRIETSCINNSRGELVRHLIIDDVIWMSNDDQEYKDIERAISTAHGKCYVGGLGMGLIIKELLKKPEVTNITVVEINPSVSKLVAPTIPVWKCGFDMWCGPLSKVEIFTNDATKAFYPIGVRNCYDWMYFDIWLEPDEEGLRLWNICKEAAKPYLKENGTIEGWYKPRLEDGKLAI